MLGQAALSSLKSSFRGELIEPGDPAYDSARKVFNAWIDKRPRLIARCADVADVMAAVRFGREQDLLVAIRGGAHNAGGLGSCDDGLVIDLSRLRYTHVEPERRAVRVGGGSTWGDVDHATHAFGLAVPAGVISTTGVAGLTLGGGIGHLSRKAGLTIDNLLGADMVLADGRFVTVDESQNEDLFWAIRGGGGNFGVVTEFRFRAHPVHTVYAGPMLWELDQAAEVMRWYREFIRQAPNDLNGFFMFMTVPPAPHFPEQLHNRKMCGIVWCYAGPVERGGEMLQPLRNSIRPALDMAGPIPYPALQSMFDALYPFGLYSYWRAAFVNEISDQAIEAHLKNAAQMPTMLSTMHMYPVSGAVQRVGKNDTAWSYRDANWAAVFVGADPAPSNKDRIANWARKYSDELRPFSAEGAYINFLMDEGADRVRTAYRDNYRRLTAVKAKYDPENVFRVNHNIAPARAGAAG